jgi:hypothetical protein
MGTFTKEISRMETVREKAPTLGLITVTIKGNGLAIK